MSTPINVSVRGFLPSKHAFKFRNSFDIKDVIDDKDINIQGKIGQNSYGLCGGIVHCAHEMFLFKEPIPNTARVPKPSEPLHHFVLQGLMDSFGTGFRDMFKMIDYHKMPNGSTELPKKSNFQLGVLKLLLKRNRLCQLMLVYNTDGKGEAFNNHQVLAYGIEERDGKGKIKIYDPNVVGSRVIDNEVINYEIVGKKVIMKQSGTNNKIVHGIFIATPPLKDPNHNFAYLASLGPVEMIKRMRVDLRKGIKEIAFALRKYFELSTSAMTMLLVEAGYKLIDIIIVMKKFFKMTVHVAWKALTATKALINDVVKAIVRVYRVSLRNMYQWLKRIKTKLDDIAKILRGAFRRTVQQMVNFFKSVGIAALELGKIISRIFRITKWREIGRILRAARYRFEDILKYMKRTAKVGAGWLAGWLRNHMKQGASTIARLLKDWYATAEKIIVSVLFDINFALQTIFDVARRILGLDKSMVTKIIK